MKPIKRITLKEVRAAYAKTGLTPKRNIWLEEGCACPLGAMLALDGRPIDDAESIDDIESVVAKRFGLNLAYVRGFVIGFDAQAALRWRPGEDRRSVWRQGCRDGRAVAKAVL